MWLAACAWRGRPVTHSSVRDWTTPGGLRTTSSRAFLFPFSGVLPCSCLCAGGLWLVVWCFRATRAPPFCFLSRLQLAAWLALRRRQSCQPSLLFLCFMRPGRAGCLVGSVDFPWSLAPFLSFLAPFSFPSRVCSPARASALVTSGLLFGAFTRPGLPPCAF